MTRVTTDLPRPPDTRPYRKPSASGPERTVAENAATRLLMRQVGWHGQSGAFYSLDEDPAAHEPGSFTPLLVVVEADEVLPPRCLCGGELVTETLYRHDQASDDDAGHLPQPATPTKSAERSPDADCVFVDVSVAPIPEGIGTVVSLTHTAGRPLNVAVNGVWAPALAERRRATFGPRDNVDLEAEACNIATGRHVTPHRGCILR